MSPFVNKNGGGQDETGPQGESLHVDIDDEVCLDCRRDVPAWVETCPECGGDVVPRADLPAPHDSLLQRFLDEDETAGDDPVG